jgi:hypothetical protein
LKLEIGMVLENVAEFYGFERLRHRCGPKMGCLLRVTGGANGIARCRRGKKRQEE